MTPSPIHPSAENVVKSGDILPLRDGYTAIVTDVTVTQELHNPLHHGTSVTFTARVSLSRHSMEHP